MAVIQQSAALTVNPAGTGTPITIVSVPVAAGSNKLLVVGVHLESNGSGGGPIVTGITKNGVALTKLDDAQSSTWGRSEIWYLKEPAVGTHDVIITLSAGTNQRCAGAIVFQGVDQVTTFRTPVKSTGSGTSVSNTVTGISATDFLLDLLTVDGNAHAIAVGASQTSKWSLESPGDDGGLSLQPGSIDGVMSWTWTTSGTYAHIATALIADTSSFPTNSTLLDDFNRSDPAPIGGIWATTIMNGVGNNTLACVSNTQLGDPINGASSGWVNAAQYGPDCEFYLDVPVLPASGQYIFLACNARQLGTASTWDGNGIIYIRGTGWQIRRYDNAVSTNFGTVNTEALVAGDKIGISNLGGVVSAWRFNAATGMWVLVTSHTDTTYNQAGYFGVELGDTTVRLDNLIGGTRVTVSVDQTRPDADSVTTGWTSTPLFSKINDSSDATVIQATAS
jgi:hypothetical protein